MSSDAGSGPSGKIKILFMDVDGVLTDGGMYLFG